MQFQINKDDFGVKVTKLKPGYFDSIKEWYENNDIPNVVLRLWTKEQLEPDSEFPQCEFIYISQIVKMDNGDFMIGYQVVDDRYDDERYPYVDWVKFSEVALAYSESDQ